MDLILYYISFGAFLLFIWRFISNKEWENYKNKSADELASIYVITTMIMVMGICRYFKVEPSFILVFILTITIALIAYNHDHEFFSFRSFFNYFILSLIPISIILMTVVSRNKEITYKCLYKKTETTCNIQEGKCNVSYEESIIYIYDVDGIDVMMDDDFILNDWNKVIDDNDKVIYVLPYKEIETVF